MFSLCPILFFVPTPKFSSPKFPPVFFVTFFLDSKFRRGEGRGTAEPKTQYVRPKGARIPNLDLSRKSVQNNTKSGADCSDAPNRSVVNLVWVSLKNTLKPINLRLMDVEEEAEEQKSD